MGDGIGRARDPFNRRAWRRAYDELSAAAVVEPLDVDDLERLASAAYLAGLSDEGRSAWISAHEKCAHVGDVARAVGPRDPEATMDKEQICAEMDRVRNDYRELLDTATVAELRKPTEGTKWNNEQLLFHMLFGYLLVQNLRFLVGGFSRLPDGASRRFATLLNAGTRPFHVINYVGSLFGARTLGYTRMERLMDRVLSGLQTSLRAQPELALDRGMHFPVGWDPYFRDFMTLRDVYHYPTQHYDHHRQQLTLARARES